MPYTTEDSVRSLVGSLGLELRTDDAATTEEVATAIDYAAGRVSFYLSRYAAGELADNAWVRGVATFIAVRWLCMRRLNDVPQSIQDEWEERKAELELILKGQAPLPGAASSRRPATVTNQHVDLRRGNNQIRTDRSRSTGVAKDYRRQYDTDAPDLR